MGLVPWCRGCAHEGATAFSRTCRDCCMGSEYVKKENCEKGSIETRIKATTDILDAWARAKGLYLSVWLTDEHCCRLAPFERRFCFANRRTDKRYNYVADFTIGSPEKDERRINIIKQVVAATLLTSEPGRGGFTYLTTRNPYLKTYDKYITNLVDDMAKRPITTCFKIGLDAMHQQDPIEPLANKTCENCGYRKEDVDDPKSHCYRCDQSRYNANPSEWVPKKYGMEAKQLFVDDLLDTMRQREFYKTLINSVYGGHVLNRKEITDMRIKDVIFNGPATIVIWADGTKTVVKAQDGEKVDYEKGLAMAISKKALGNEGNYYDQFSKWLKNAPVVKEEPVISPETIKEVERVTRRPSKKVEITDEEIQARSDALFPDYDMKISDEEIQTQSDALFADFDKKVAKKKTTRRTVKKDK